MNFFIFKRDPPFYQEVVKPYVENKLEKTFIDWYMLGADEGADSIYTRKILDYFEIESKIQFLNFFEVCLLVEVTLKYGSDRQKNKAKNLARMHIMEQQNE